jgi:uncharacterized protein YraI
MKRIYLTASVVALLFILLPHGLTQQETSVTAEAQNEVNLRAEPGIQAEQLGQMQIGVLYPVIGRSEFFPWVLLGDPVTGMPIGWAFRDIVVITGNLNSVPFVTTVVTGGAQAAQITPTATLPAGQTPTTGATQAAVTNTATPNFTVAGTVRGEVNIRYGPGIDYPRVGVAQAGERFQVTAWHTQLPWVQIRYENSPTGNAWIAIDLLDIQGDIYTLPSISSTIFNLPTLTPTPSVIQSSSLLSQETVTISPQFTALGNQIWQQVLAQGFDPQTSQFGSLFLLDLQTGEAITFGSDIVYRGTSVNKINILAALYGVLQAAPNEAVATDIANTMICSENAATNRLLSIIGESDEWQGAQQVTNMMQTIGIQDSFLLAPYTVDPENPPIPPYAIPVPESDADNEIAHPEFYNRMTVDDMGWMLASIYQCGYQESGPLIENFPEGSYTPRECRQMVHVMASNTVDGLLKAGVPADTRVAHKHGWVNDTHSNAAIFFTPGGDYVLVMSFHSAQTDATGERYLAFPNTLPAFAETSRTVYNYFNPDNPQEAIREGFIPEAPSCNFAGSPVVADLQQSIWDR